MDMIYEIRRCYLVQKQTANDIAKDRVFPDQRYANAYLPLKNPSTNAHIQQIEKVEKLDAYWHGPSQKSRQAAPLKI